jgi:hypothetical protein
LLAKPKSKPKSKPKTKTKSKAKAKAKSKTCGVAAQEDAHVGIRVVSLFFGIEFWLGNVQAE